EAVPCWIGGQRDDSQRRVVVGGDEQVVLAAREARSVDRCGPWRWEQRRIRCHRDDAEPVGGKRHGSPRRRNRRNLSVGETVGDTVRIVLLSRRRGELVAR